MEILIDELNLVAASVMTAIFVIPTLFHIAADLASKPGRNFSIIPNKLRHLLINLVRLGMIWGTGLVSIEIRGEIDPNFIWIGLAVFLLLVAVLGATDRRLTINGTTGIVRWRKISLPWWPAKTTFIDQVSLMKPASKKSGQKVMMSVLGIGELAQFYSVNYNGNNLTTGHSTKRMLTWMSQKVNDYIEAFRRHDSDEAKAKRNQIRERHNAAGAPKRKRKKAQANREQSSAAQKASDRKAKQKAEIARKKEERRRKADDKFR